MKNANFIFFLFLASFVILFSGCKKKEEAKSISSEEKEPSTITLSSESSKIAGIKTEIAEIRPFSKTVKATGILTFNPKKFACITSRVPGRIEEVAAFEGDRIKAGERLLTLYSLDFLSAQAEFIQIKEREEKTRETNNEEEKGVAVRMLDSAAGRLKVMGVTDAELEELAKRKTVQILLDVKAPFEGSIIQSSAVSGDYVETGTELLKIADVSTLWALVSIYEKDLSAVSPGSRVEIRVEAYPNEVFHGTLTVLSDVEEEETRTVKGRIELPNPSLKLKPGMYAEVTISPAASQKILVVSEAAVRKVEGKNFVFIPVQNNSFEVREVQVGRTFAGHLEIIKGLKEGERVVSEGSFALKSELLRKLLEGD